MSVTDRDVLRRLAGQVMEIARLPVQTEKRNLWAGLNALRPVRPMVWINEIPWQELADEELTCVCRDPFARHVEGELRRTLYTWHHMRTDSVIEPVYWVPIVIHDSGYGMDVDGEQGESEYGRGARSYQASIHSETDVDKIQLPVVQADWPETHRRLEQVTTWMGDVLPVQNRGVTHLWIAPWDILIEWYGISQLYLDMVDRPALVHRAISRLMDALCARLDQLDEQRLLSNGEYNHRVGSGGLGITDELPQADFDASHVRPMDQWGTSTGQIFSDVSPDMHEEFCLQYERRWLERFGLNCYGCCEPLHHKMHLVRSIPRLRRVSMSRWIDVDTAAEAMNGDYIFSYKPNPAVLAAKHWEPDVARNELLRVFERTRGMPVEIIMKDITTCRGDARRLWQWCDLAVEMALSRS